ncbi:hypothetical protein RR48_00918 [Papilio machaon]|uniref:Uncharacterized protein n=1 Tax=Papilio machaon TaxID=76193 RepID=A0A0N1PGM6_PAPMA|nr:hypothetical protein RR48_00918 [Papilio machaon]
MSTQNRPYQGYPYVNPVVIDVPSIDPTTAGRWTNLPRRPIGGVIERPGTSRDNGVNEIRAEEVAKDSSESDVNRTEENPVVYIDVPESGESSVIESSNRNEHRDESFVQVVNEQASAIANALFTFYGRRTERTERGYLNFGLFQESLGGTDFNQVTEPDLHVTHVPSIDPTTAGRWTNLPRRPIGGVIERPGTSRDNGVNEIRAEEVVKDSSESDVNRTEENPVVYIDVPESGESSVVESQSNRNEQREESFVQDTILYDPFKDRRIELRVTGDESDEEPSRYPSRGEQTSRPVPPNTLNVASPGSSSGYTTSPTFGTSTNPNLPGLMSKEAGYYGRQTPDDMFPLGPIPVSEFPDPPPAYTEIDRVNQTDRVNEPTPPRTEVITTETSKVRNQWDGIQKLVNAINNHNKAYLKERDGNSDWLEEENDSLSAPFGELTKNEVGSETDSADIIKRHLISSELNQLRNMKLELEKDLKRKKNTIKRKPDNIAKKSLGNFKMERKETMVTLPILNDSKEEHDCGDKCSDTSEFDKLIEHKKENYKDLIKVIAKQLHVVENFIDYLKEEKTIGRQGKTEFDEILESINNKPIVIKTTTEATTVAEQQAAMVTFIDESDIRDALKNDPLVKRIIKIAKKKRGEYMKDLGHALA